MDQFERRYNTIVIMICMYGGDMMSEYEFIIIAKTLNVCSLSNLCYVQRKLCKQWMTDCRMRLYYL